MWRRISCGRDDAGMTGCSRAYSGVGLTNAPPPPPLALPLLAVAFDDEAGPEVALPAGALKGQGDVPEGFGVATAGPRCDSSRVDACGSSGSPSG